MPSTALRSTPSSPRSRPTISSSPRRRAFKSRSAGRATGQNSRRSFRPSPARASRRSKESARCGRRRRKWPLMRHGLAKCSSNARVKDREMPVPGRRQGSKGCDGTGRRPGWCRRRTLSRSARRSAPSCSLLLCALNGVREQECKPRSERGQVAVVVSAIVHRDGCGDAGWWRERAETGGREYGSGVHIRHGGADRGVHGRRALWSTLAAQFQP